MTSKKYTPADLDLKVKRASTGLGLFADEAIRKGTCIIEYVGPEVPKAKRDSINSRYLFEVSKSKTIDGSPRYNTARYINHGCDPNAEPVIHGGRIFIMAIKPIAPGDEITYDYGKDYFDMFIKPHGCRCPAHMPKAA
jgi:SET domain-containing protein